MKNPHVILGVDRHADLEAIKRAYLKLAKAVHPDAGGSKEDFIRLQSAFEAMTQGCASPETVPSGQHAASEERSAGRAEWKSYEDIKKAVRDRFDRDGEWRPPAGRHRQPRSRNDLYLAVVLTPLCVGAVATWLCCDGRSLELSLWSFSFAVTLVLIVYVFGLIAIVGSSPLTSSLRVYRRLMVLVLIVAFVSIVGSNASPSTGWNISHRRRPVISRKLVPKWWPIPRGKRWRIP